MYVDNNGNGGNGKDGNGDGNSDGNGDGNGNDAPAAINGNNVDEDNSGNSRTLIGQWQLDNNNRTTTMRW